jgi:hypothetical protein
VCVGAATAATAATATAAAMTASNLLELELGQHGHGVPHELEPSFGLGSFHGDSLGI